MRAEIRSWEWELRAGELGSGDGNGSWDWELRAESRKLGAGARMGAESWDREMGMGAEN